MAEGEQGGEGYTPKQLEAEESRTVSDAELIKDGAQYEQIGDQKILMLTPEQTGKIARDSNQEESDQLRQMTGSLGGILEARYHSRLELTPEQQQEISSIIGRVVTKEIDRKELTDKFVSGLVVDERIGRDEHYTRLKEMVFVPRTQLIILRELTRDRKWGT